MNIGEECCREDQELPNTSKITQIGVLCKKLWLVKVYICVGCKFARSFGRIIKNHSHLCSFDSVFGHTKGFDRKWKEDSLVLGQINRQ